MPHIPAIPSDLIPLVNAVAGRMNSRRCRQRITRGKAPTAQEIETGLRLFTPLVAEAVEAILEQGYTIKKHEIPLQYQMEINTSTDTGEETTQPQETRECTPTEPQ